MVWKSLSGDPSKSFSSIGTLVQPQRGPDLQNVPAQSRILSGRQLHSGADNVWLTFSKNPQSGPNLSFQSAQNNKSVLSPPLKSPTTSKPSAISVEPSFIVKIEEIRPNQVHANRSLDHPQGFFLPPDRRNGYDTKSGHTFRYAYQNNVLQAAPSDAVNIQALEIYRSATIFSQATSTDHLLMVPFDARTRNVANHTHDWRSISFNHKGRTSTSTYASLAFIGEKENLPAPLPPGWNQLIPRPYRFPASDGDGNTIQSTTSFGGLIGELPLLIALAAFSSVPNALSATLVNHTRGGRWRPHNHNTGRQYVSTCALVLSNRHRCTRTRLGRHCLPGPHKPLRVYHN